MHPPGQQRPESRFTECILRAEGPSASTLHPEKFASVVRLSRDASAAQFASPLLTVYQRSRAFLLFPRVSFNSFARPREFIRTHLLQRGAALPVPLPLRSPGGFIRTNGSNLSVSEFSWLCCAIPSFFYANSSIRSFFVTFGEAHPDGRFLYCDRQIFREFFAIFGKGSCNGLLASNVQKFLKITQNVLRVYVSTSLFSNLASFEIAFFWVSPAWFSIFSVDLLLDLLPIFSNSTKLTWLSLESVKHRMIRCAMEIFTGMKCRAYKAYLR